MITRIVCTHAGIVFRAQRPQERRDSDKDRCYVARHVESAKREQFTMKQGRLARVIVNVPDLITIGDLDFALATRNNRPLSVKAEKRGGEVFKDARLISEIDALRLHEFDQEIDALIAQRRALMLDALERGRALSALDLIEDKTEEKASEQ